MDQFGTPGLANAVLAPGLLAVVDQHAAEVRDMLGLDAEGSETTPGAVLLAGYARGLLDRSGMNVRNLKTPDARAAPDWLTLRLLGVCALSRAQSWQPPMPRVG